MRLQVYNAATQNPNGWKINDLGEGVVRAITRSELENSVLKGNVYPPATSLINLTSSNESAVFYIKSDEEADILFSTISIIPTPSTGGSGNTIIRVYFNDNAGTIISTATPLFIKNPNAKVSTPFAGDAFEGAEGLTRSGGDLFTQTTRDSQFNTQIAIDEVPVVLGRGNSLTVTIEPAPGNTSQNFIVFGILRRELEL